MPRNWRCANGHAWTGDLGALTFCPDCGSADVYEVRPQFDSKASAPAANAPDRTIIQPTAKSGPVADTLVALAFADTLIQAPAVPANVGETLIQPARGPGETLVQPRDPGTTIMQVVAPANDGGTLVQPLVQESNDASTLDMPVLDGLDATVHQPAATAPSADGSTIIAPPVSRASRETFLDQAPPPSAAEAPTLDTPAHNGPSHRSADYISTVDYQRQIGSPPPNLSAQETRAAPPPQERGKDGRTTAIPQVAGYEILGVLGRGGMGVVYKARQVKLNRIVALKMILAGGHAGKHDKQRFATEANAVAALHHSNIVQIYETGERDGLPYFSLEFCDGGSLQQKLGGQPLPPRIAADIAEQLSRAMQYAHERGIVHRDLKPANILFSGAEIAAAKDKTLPSKDSKAVTQGTKVWSKESKTAQDTTKDASASKTGQSKTGPSVASSRGGMSTASLRASRVMPKVTDFGLAKRLEEDSGLTGSGTILGTPSYMAPEQAEGRSSSVGPAADIHALGAILYEMLTGRPPFLGDNAIETMSQVRLMDPVPPTRIQPKTPNDLETVCLKCLQKEIHKRYASAGELADDLRRFLDGEPIAARPVPIWEKGWKWAKRRPAQAALIGLSAAVLIVAMLGGVAFIRYQAGQNVIQRGLTEQAVEQKQHAEANFNSAREAVDKLLVRVGGERLEHVPKAEKMRQELLLDSLLFYERFLKANGDDPALRREAGWAYQRLGRVRGDLGQRSAAITAYQNAIGLFEGLAKETGDHQADDKLDLAETQRQLAVILEADGRRKEADTAYDAARAGLRDLADNYPDQSAYRAQLADLLLVRAGQFYNRRRLTEAEDACRQALAECEQLVRTDPSPANRFRRAKTQANLGAIISVGDRFGLAIDELRKAVTWLTTCVNASPQDPEYVKELGQAMFNLANVYFRDGKSEDAGRTYQQSIQRLQKLTDDFPQTQDYRLALGLAYDNYAVFLKNTKGLRAAEPQREKARAVYDQLRRDVPDNLDYRLRYAVDLDEHAIYLAANDRLDEAITEEKIAVELLGGLAAADPLNPEMGRIVRENARRHLNLGQLYAQKRQTDGAEAEFALAAGLLESAASRRLKGDDSWSDLPAVYMNQANLFQGLNREKAVERTMRQMVTVSQRVVAEHPDQPDALATLASAQFNLASLAGLKPAEALDLTRQAVQRQRTAFALASRRADMVVMMGIYGTRLVTLLADQGDHAAAATAAAELTRDIPEWRGWPAVASQLARCVRLARTDKTLSDEQKAKLSLAYGKQALELLQKAAAAGFNDVAAIQDSTDMNVLRTDPVFRPEFEKVLAEIEARNKK